MAALAALATMFAGVAAASPAQATEAAVPVVTAAARFDPAGLPRLEVAPTTLSLGFTSRNRYGGWVPGLESISMSLAPTVSFDDASLPVCRIAELYESYEGARTSDDVCARSLVGTGTVDSEITLPEQFPVFEEGTLRAYVGPRSKTSRIILAQVTTNGPRPLVYVIPFHLQAPETGGGYTIVAFRMREIFGTCIRTCPVPGPYSFEGVYTHIARLEMTLGRSWSGGGRPHSFVAARCPAVDGHRRRFKLLEVRLGYEEGPIGHSAAAATGSCRSTG